MIVNEALARNNMTKYRLSKESGVPQATINDICSGKANLEKCAAGTLYKIAKILGITVEDILESAAKEEYRSSFEVFKSNVCHRVKDMGDIDFMITLLESNEIRVLYERKWYPESLYLLAMLDYLSRVHNVPLCTRYNDLRMQKLDRPIYPSGIIMTSKVTKTDQPLREAEENAIPEFRRFNIIENEVRDVV